MAKRNWSDLSPTQRKAVAVLGAVEVLATTAMLVDLSRRPSSKVRGPKLLWRTVSVVQPVGPIAYFAFGRRS